MVDDAEPAQEQPNNPLHGITLKAMLEELIDRYGFEELGARIEIRCFTHDPSLSSSLKFLRRTKWARDLVEELFLEHQQTEAAQRASTASGSPAEVEPE